MKKLENIQLAPRTPRQIQRFCLELSGALVFLCMILGVLATEPLQHHLVLWLSGLGLLFAGVSRMQPVSSETKPLVLIGLLFCGWMLLLQAYDYLHFAVNFRTGARFVCSAFLCEYLMLLPCGGLLEEGEKPEGLISFTGWYVLGGAVFTLCMGLIYLLKVPVFLSRCIGWMGYNLTVNWHYTLTGRIFMICFGTTLALMAATRIRGCRILLGLLAGAEFVGMALTDCRAANLMGHCLLGGIAFFWVYGRCEKRPVWQRWIFSILLGLAVIAAAYGISRCITMVNYDYLSGNLLPTQMSRTQAPDQVLHSGPPRGMAKDTEGLNGRTAIWAAVFERIREQPQVLLTGVRDTSGFIDGSFGQASAEKLVAHSHNAWLETLLQLGVPGFLLALQITWLSVKNAVILLFFRKTDWFQRIICLITFCILGMEFLEVGLFCTEVPRSFENMYFLLAAGYLTYWEKLGRFTSRKQQDAV